MFLICALITVRIHATEAFSVTHKTRFSHFFADRIVFIFKFLKAFDFSLFYIAFMFHNYGLTQSMRLINLLIIYFTINFFMISRKISKIAHIHISRSYKCDTDIVRSGAYFFRIWLSIGTFLGRIINLF